MSITPEDMARAHALLEDWNSGGAIPLAVRIAGLFAEADRLARELALAQHGLLTGGSEHARDLGHLADRNAELAERTRERDGARVAVCERAALGRPGHESEHDFDEPDDAAEYFGWPDLYTNPEEPTT